MGVLFVKFGDTIGSWEKVREMSLCEDETKHHTVERNKRDVLEEEQSEEQLVWCTKIQ